MEFDCILKTDIVINTTWVTESGCQALKDAVKFSTKSSYNLEDVVQVESCVHLSRTAPSTVPCKLHIKLNKTSKYVIKRVDLISEARIVECYGTFEEYLDTVHGEFMDDFEGSTVYSISKTLPSTQEITLKFARMRHENEMWLYGLLFTVEQVNGPSLKVAGIDLSNVNSMLTESSQPISDKAEYCRKLLQQCGSSMNSSGVVDAHVLLKMFEGEYFKPLGETSKSMSKCLTRLIPFIMNKSESSTNNNDSSQMTENSGECHTANTVLENSVTSSSFPSNNNNNHKNINNNFSFVNSNDGADAYLKIIKDYVDKSIDDMEERLTERLEQRIRDIELTQNSKLDAIMKLLQERQ